MCGFLTILIDFGLFLVVLGSIFSEYFSIGVLMQVILKDFSGK